MTRRPAAPPPRSAARAPGVAAALAAALALAACASSGEKALSVETYVHNAQTYVDGGLHDSALQQWRRALELDPGSQKALLGEAFALLALGQGEMPSSGAYIQEAERAFAQLEARGFGENGWKVDLGRGMTAWRLAELWDRKTGLRIRTADADDPVNRASIEEARGQRERHRDIARKAFLAVLEDGSQPMAKDNLVALWHLATLSALRAEATADYDVALGYFRRFEDQIEKSKRLWQEGAKREPSLAATFERKLMGAKSQ
jgi:tetratricopeptide (TPR) repeat protein